MSDKKTIVDLERRFWDTMISKDADTASSLVARKVLLTGAQGVSTIEKDTFARMMNGATWDLNKYELDDVAVMFPTPDVAVIGYTVTEHLTVDGEKFEMKAADASVWVHKDGEWQAVLHTESILGDPFGRDRVIAVKGTGQNS